ncbi:MAG: Multicopper oxidase with three cupredoxin domains (includes FtsP and CotA) [Verrucomicrobia bacterium]|nr:MAG: Multicopper oxidase with three cupredoxin domains (includes FtsP and CotA) [Verrucomicrobiota bacterium]
MVEVDLEIAEEILSPAGSPVRALTINGTVPGPTLRFKEGDTARIHVHNRLAHEETSLHWHGLLVPNNQDGVPHLTTPPIAPGTTFTYEFPLRQSGTYWFHSHTGLQEQRGVLGSIVIEPREGVLPKADREQVLVLTDWSDENPDEILRSLKRGTRWYGIKKGTAQSLSGALKTGNLKNYLKREKSRMPPMDVSDIAYDAFLINGKRHFPVSGHPGETLRLRLINGSAATYFYVESATGPLTIVAADGPPVRPTPVKRLFIGIAETYDLLLTIPPSGSWEIRATAQDGSGSACATVGNGPLHKAPEVPKPNLYSMEDVLNAAMEESDSPMESPLPAARKAPQSGSTPSPGAGAEERPLSPYRQLQALDKTAFLNTLPRRTLELHLTGDMQRYLWSFNGKTIDEESLIPVKRGEILRLELVNDTMMHHPIHLHGHFFRLLNGQGDFAPLKHTVDVPPMSRRTVEFEANEQGDWMFHCHILYHMMEGMARVVHYEPAGESPQTQTQSPPHLGEHAMAMHYAFADFSVLSSASEGTARIQSGRHSLLVPWELGWRHTEGKVEYETDILYEHYTTENFGALAGMRLSNQAPGGNRPLLGGWYRLPYLVTATGTVDGKGALRLELSKELQLTPRLTLHLRARYDTRQRWEEAVTASYAITKRLSATAAYHTQYGLGAGLTFHF